MLLIKTTMVASAIHRFGICADESVAKDTVVWKFQPGFDLDKTKEEVEELPEVARVWFKLYGYLDRHFERYVLSFDNARFINHSQDPNIRPDYSQDTYAVGLAVRDIAKDEELTINYLDIEDSLWLKA